MLDNFTGINDAEKKQLIDAIAQITVLIAGADGMIDTAETAWASKMTKIRSYSTEDELQDFYKEVGKTFDEDLNALIKDVHNGVEERTKHLVDSLAELNIPLAKLPNKLGATLYHSYQTFAKHVAESSGGFLRMWSISGEEKKLINLPMLTPIVHIKEDKKL